ncbi:MAG: sulfate/molybdate ABC transporter ATP-binding protein [Ruminococcaceae bacterium]|nr:sulfate/molybdate ABC transporter ATP-binding protein [Oscillospiraceae bacterium]
MSLKVDIHKKLKGFALDVCFDSGGAPLGILGASGSGKSMTLKCIAGIESPDSGHISVNGRVLYDSARKINVKPQKRNIGYLFQNYALFPNMTVAQNIACALPGSRAGKAPKVDELVRRFALDGLAGRYPAQLSGGQQQRVALARILAYEPEVLLLDEPFSALDAFLKEALQVEMRQLLAQYGGDTVLVTHNRDEVYRLSEDLLVLDGGRALSMAPTEETFEKPRQVQVARLTGCKNFSRAVKLDDTHVEATDWRLRLQVAAPIPENLTHIGIRAHYFVPADDDMAMPNRFPIAVHSLLEDPFEWNVMFHLPGVQHSPQTGIWWKYAKQQHNGALPKMLSVTPQNVLLLEGDG